MQIDIAANRAARKWSLAELVLRAAWETLGAPLFALIPRQLWGWRCAMLRAFGARIGRNVHVFPNVKITIPWNLEIGDEAALGDGAIVYNLGVVKVGPRATISQFAHLCAGTHDYHHPDFPLIKLPIEIGEGAWICAEAFVGPGVTVGAYSIVGARAVAMKSIDAWTIAAGNPARTIGPRPPFSPKVGK